MRSNYIPDKFFIILYLAMNGVGVVAYMMGLDYYVRPSKDALTLILILNLTVLLAWVLFSILFYDLNRTLLKERVGRKFHILAGKANRLPLAYFIFVFSLVAVFSYIFVFNSHFTFAKLISGVELSESMRPDVVGNVPFYWSFSVVLSSVAIPLALNHFLILRNLKKSASAQLLWGLILVALTLVLGDKSSFLGLLFFFAFIVGRASFIRVVLFVVVFFVFYALMKFVNYSTTHDLSMFLDLVIMSESIFRRVFLINVSSMGVVLDNIVFNGYDFSNGFRHIKEYVFYTIYGYLPGGTPVSYVIGSFYLISPWLIPIFVFFSTFIVLFVRLILLSKSPPYVYYALLYLNFYGAIVLVSGNLIDYFLRSLLPALIIFFSARVVVMKLKVGASEALVSAKY